MLADAMDLVVPMEPSSTRDRIGRCRNVPMRNRRRSEKLALCGMCDSGEWRVFAADGAPESGFLGSGEANKRSKRSVALAPSRTA